MNLFHERRADDKIIIAAGAIYFREGLPYNHFGDAIGGELRA